MSRSLIKSLLKPQAYPEPTSKVSCIQTYVSFIFLTDSYAYKIKKPVDFGFLNFSTIDRRRFYCNEEVRLNRRLSPEMYLGVVELRLTKHGASFNGDGTILDYAVKMKRLPASCMLDKLVDHEIVDKETIQKVGAFIAKFHAKAPTSSSVQEYGKLDRIKYNWQENFEQVIQYEHETLPFFDRISIQQFVTNFMTQNSQLFQKRVDEGHIRECDGDIHLENICIEDDLIHIFDCIEFNDRFRCSDTAADIAFLLMDLDFHNHHNLSKIALNSYLSVSKDDSAVPLILFYQMYRAFVRGKVVSFQLNDLGIELEQKELAKQNAINYFRLARGYMERMRQPQTLYITCGLIGCGKSTLASALSFELGINSFSSDIVRKKLCNIKQTTAVKVQYGSDIYNPKKSEETYNELLKLAEIEIKQGSSVILDASFMYKYYRELCIKLSKRTKIRFVILHIQCKLIENKRRLNQRTSQVNSVSDGRIELLQKQSELFEAPKTDEGTILLLDSKFSPETLLNTVYERLLSC